MTTGRTTADIAREAGVTREAVRFHLKNAYAKTGTSSQAELVSFVFRLAG